MDEPHTAQSKPEPANAAGSEPAPARAADLIDASGAAGCTGAGASSGSVASTLNSAQDARWPAHVAAAQAGEQKRAFRQLAQTSDVDAPQAAHVARSELGDDMVKMSEAGARETREIARLARAHFVAPFSAASWARRFKPSTRLNARRRQLGAALQYCSCGRSRTAGPQVGHGDRATKPRLPPGFSCDGKHRNDSDGIVRHGGNAILASS